jgi:tetratricopeptide (TPR) repeat protein
MGEVHKYLGDMQRAVEYFERSLCIAREMNQKREEGGALSALGAAHRNLGNIQKATDYYEQALLIARSIGDRYLEGDALGGLGNVNLAMGKLQQAVEYYQGGLHIAREHNDVIGTAMLEANLGKSLGLSGQIKEATIWIEKAIGDFEKAGYSGHVQTAKKMLAELNHISVSDSFRYDE